MFRFLFNLNTGAQTLIGAVLGICVGLLFGEYASYLHPLGSLYVMLLEMMVVPYLLFGITFSLGSLTFKSWRQILRKVWKPFIAIWILSLFLIMSFSNLIPSSSRLPLASPAVDKDIPQTILSYFIPQNPFYALTHNYVPAITVFCIIIGLGLMRMEKKEKVTDVLSVFVKVISKIFQWLTKLAPLGTFGLFASAAGTITFTQFSELQFYIYSYIIFVLLVVFVFLPFILKCFVPIEYRSIFSTMKTGLILAFATGISVIALPFIQRVADEYAKKRATEGEETKDYESIVLISYSFAQIGNLIVILFIFFSGFYYHSPLTEQQSILAPFLGFLTSFGSPTTTILAVKFFVTEWNLPVDATNLYVQMMPITRSFQTLASVMCILVVTFIAYFSQKDHMKLHRLRLFGIYSIAPLLFILSFPLSKLKVLDIKNQPFSYWKTSMKETVRVMPEVAYLSRGEATGKESGNLSDDLDAIKSIGTLRVGYNSQVMPFVYWNDAKELVGFDVAFVYTLAHILDAKIDFIPYDWNTLESDLESGVFDIAIGAIFMTHSRLINAMMSRPYLSTNFTLMAPADLAETYTSYTTLKGQKEFNLGILDDPIWEGYAKFYFPKATLHKFKSVEEYFLTNPVYVQAFLWTDETAVAWPTKYPNFSVVKLFPPIGKEFFAYAFNKDSERLITFVNYWIDLLRLKGVFEKQYNIWVLGKPPHQPKPRWSILDVFFPSLKKYEKVDLLDIKKEEQQLSFVD